MSLGVLLLTAAAGACTGTGGSGVVYFTNFTAGYVPSSLAASQPILVETYGSPVEGATAEQVNRSTVEGLRTFGPVWMGRNYTGDPSSSGPSGYRLRVAYGAPSTVKLDELCKGTPSYTADPAEGSTLAGICRGGTTIAYGAGSPGAAPDLNGETFRRFVGLLGREVMPRQNPVTEDDCLFRNCE
jgi:hypothetical protein